MGTNEIGADQQSRERERPATELTIHELEMLLEQKRLAQGRERLQRISQEEDKSPREAPPAIGQHRIMSPDTAWLSDKELRERFGPWRLEPLASDSTEGILTDPSSTKRQSWRDRVLLLVEVAALLGLAIVIYISFSTVRELNHETARVMEAVEPTRAPTPVATLPGSSVSPRESHLPPFYQGIVQPANPIPLVTPTLGPQAAIRIVIDRIRVDAPVVEGDDWESLKKGVGHRVGSGNPGQRGNMVASAHNDVFGEIFRDLDKLESGDEILVFTQERSYRYVVMETRIVEPTEIGVLESTQEPILTLITCYPYMVDSHRAVVVAELSP